MKNAIELIIITALLALLTSCRTPKQAAPGSVTDSSTITVKDRPVVIPAVQDSSSLKALFKCDSSNRVILASYSSLWSQYMSVTTAVQPTKEGGMSISINTQTHHPATTAIAHDSIITRNRTVYMPGVPYKVEVEVDKPLSFFSKFFIYSGAAAWLILLLKLVKRFYKPSK